MIKTVASVINGSFSGNDWSTIAMTFWKSKREFNSIKTIYFLNKFCGLSCTFNNFLKILFTPKFWLLKCIYTDFEGSLIFWFIDLIRIHIDYYILLWSKT